MFSEKLKQYRESCGLTQEQFAKETKISRGVISMIEAGKRPPSKSVLSLLSEYSGKSIDWWYDKEEKEYDELNALNSLMDYMVDNDRVDDDGAVADEDKKFLWRMMEAEFKKKKEKKLNKKL